MTNTTDSETRCSAISRDLDEPLAGTGVKACARWLIVEDRTSWARSALDTLPEADRRAVERAADRLSTDEAQVRIQAIRRPRRGDDAPLRVYVADAESRRLWRLDVSTYGDLDDVDFSGVDTGAGPSGGLPVDEPLVLVCMHTSRDACCALHGAPVFKALDDEIGPRAWQTSHVGGHRFAANVVCVPSGICYGRISPDEVGALLTADARGDVYRPGERMRGDARYPRDVQFADVWLRARDGIFPRDVVALRNYAVEPAVADASFTVELGVADPAPFADGEARSGRETRHRIHVRKFEASPARLTSCDKVEPKHVDAYEVVAAERVSK